MDTVDLFKLTPYAPRLLPLSLMQLLLLLTATFEWRRYAI
jgi:hypothetical protein